jgi:type I restriction enzyme, S subunit
MSNDQLLTENSQVSQGYKQTEVGLIPEDWNAVTLMDCSKKITDGEHLTPRRFSDGYFLLSARNIRDGYISLSDVDYVQLDEYLRIRKRCNPDPGDVLISCSGSIGRVAIVPNGLKCVMVRSAAMIKPDENRVSGAYIQYSLQSSLGQKQIFASLNQGAQANLFLNHIEGLYIPLPPTKAEQETIAQALSETDALIGSLEQLIAKKRHIKQGAMQELLTASKRLQGFGGEWKVTQLGDVAEIIMGQSPNSSCYNIQGKGLPLIQGNADISNRKTIKRIFTTEITKKGIYGDILMSVRAPVGEISRAIFDVCLGRGVCSIRNGSRNEFLYHYLIWREPDWVGLSKGSTFDSVNSADVKTFQVFIPVEISEQNAITTILSDMDTAIAVLEEKLTKTRQLKQGMMHELLTGRIRLVERAQP